MKSHRRIRCAALALVALTFGTVLAAAQPASAQFGFGRGGYYGPGYNGFNRGYYGGGFNRGYYGGGYGRGYYNRGYLGGYGYGPGAFNRGYYGYGRGYNGLGYGRPAPFLTPGLGINIYGF